MDTVNQEEQDSTNHGQLLNQESRVMQQLCQLLLLVTTTTTTTTMLHLQA
jgi:hypothetical protein